MQLTNNHCLARLGAFSICSRLSKPTISDATTASDTAPVGRQSWNSPVSLADTKEVGMHAAGLVGLANWLSIFGNKRIECVWFRYKDRQAAWLLLQLADRAMMILLPKENVFSVELALDTTTWCSSTCHIRKMEDENISYLFGHIRQQVRRWATLSGVIVWVVEGPGTGTRGQNREHYLPHWLTFLLYKYLVIFSQCLEGTDIYVFIQLFMSIYEPVVLISYIQ